MTGTHAHRILRRWADHARRTPAGATAQAVRARRWLPASGAAVVAVLLATLSTPPASAITWTEDMIDGPTPHYSMIELATCARNVFDYYAAAKAEQARVEPLCRTYTRGQNENPAEFDHKLVSVDSASLACDYEIADDGYTFMPPPRTNGRCAGHWGLNKMVGAYPWHFEVAVWIDGTRGGNFDGTYVYGAEPLFQEVNGNLYLAAGPRSGQLWDSAPWSECNRDVTDWKTKAPVCRWLGASEQPVKLPKYTGIS